MLRELFGLPPRTEETSDLLRALQQIRRFADALHKKRGNEAQADEEKRYHFSIWSLGFVDSLEELEESLICTRHLASKVHSAHVEDMTAEERSDYRRYVYFYKNGLIRIFSLLDKLGYFLNEWYALGTENVKERFSYFTMLRNMHERRLHPALQQQLYEIKTAYKVSMSSLREQRNMEIHYMNADLLDDWKRVAHATGGKLHVENAKEQTDELQQGFEMALRTLLTVYLYLNEQKEA